MADDLEAFLKRAAARRAQQRQGARRLPPRAAPPPTATGPAAPAPPVARLADIGGSQRKFEQRSLAIEAEAEGLGQDIKAEDQRLEAHIAETFTHRVGQLDEDPGFAGDDAVGDVAGAGAAADLMKILSAPQSVRNAVLLAEILARPEHRWE